MKRFVFLLVLTISLFACKDEAWNTAVSENTIEAYQNYIDENPDGKYVDSAKVRIDKINDANDWAEALSDDYYSAYTTYLENHPDGIYKDLAQHKLDSLDELAQQYEDQQEFEWQQACKENTLDAYEQFASNSDSEHQIEALEKAFLIADTANKQYLFIVDFLKSMIDDNSLKNLSNYLSPDGIIIDNGFGETTQYNSPYDDLDDDIVNMFLKSDFTSKEGLVSFLSDLAYDRAYSDLYTYVEKKDNGTYSLSISSEDPDYDSFSIICENIDGQLYIKEITYIEGGDV